MKRVKAHGYISICEQVSDYDWIVFTSANAVTFFIEILYELGMSPQVLQHTAIACVGPITAQRLSEFGLTATIVPTEHVAEGLISAFKAHSMSGQRVLLPRAASAREALPRALRAQGASVDVMPVYETCATQLSKKDQLHLNANHVDAVTFTSSSTVDALEKWLGRAEQANFKRNVFAFCIGPITSNAAKRHGYEWVITADTYTVSGLIESLIAHLPKLSKKESSL